MWRYNEGNVTHIGAGHSGEVTGVKISPDGQYIVSVSNDGAIMRWKFPVKPLTATCTPTSSVPPLSLPMDTEVAVTQKLEVPSSRQEQEEMEMGVATPKQDSSRREEMEVGGATPKQEE